MSKAIRIIEILVGVIVLFPIFIMTAYESYRQNINPAAPILIDILPDWHWSIWLSILLFICLIMIILEFFRRSSNSSGITTRDNYYKSPHVERDLVGDVVYGNKVTNELPPNKPFDITTDLIKNESWVSVNIPNPVSKTIECYCVLKLIELNGNIDNELKSYLTKYSKRISWSGGDSKGEGVKFIETEHAEQLNITTPTPKGLRFEMAKGSRDLDSERQYGIGDYKLTLDLLYKSVEENEYQSKMIEVRFLCYKNISTINEVYDNVIESVLGQWLIGIDPMEHLYVKILK